MFKNLASFAFDTEVQANLKQLWPMPMYGSGYVFSKEFFTGWVVVGILWLFCSTFCVGLYPLWEGRHSMAHTFKGIVRDLTGKGKPPLKGRTVELNEKADQYEEGTTTKERDVKAPSASMVSGDAIKSDY